VSTQAPTPRIMSVDRQRHEEEVQALILRGMPRVPNADLGNLVLHGTWLLYWQGVDLRKHLTPWQYESHRRLIREATAIDIAIPPPAHDLRERTAVAYAQARQIKRLQAELAELR
jgi:hypothetical protein